ncbi:MAG TPA: protein translocase subunit SecD [Thermoanaerobaculia bacterium]|nr:protein translocase subunit SecD [Thermoanaerobaculia bacterium]
MKKSNGWRVVLTLAVLIGSVGAYWWRGNEALKRSPTAPPNPSMKDVLKNGMKLGLDLKGGIHLVMQVKTGDALKAEAQDAAEHLKDEARTRGVILGAIPPPEPSGFTVTLTPQTEPSKLKDVVKRALSPTDWTVDERGSEWRFSLKDPARIQTEDQAVRQAVETIRNRVDALGVAEPVIQRQGTDRILVQLPGVDDPSRVKEIIGTTGLLELKLVDDKGGPYPNEEAAKQAYAGAIPADLELVEGFNEDAEARTRTPNVYVLKRVAAVNGRDLKNARVGHDRYNQPAVEFFLNAVGADKFGKATGANVGKRLAIVLDKRVQSAPVINSQINDTGIIEGQFTPERADGLALVLRSGALPAEMVVLEERTVGPSLGLDSIKQGVLASIVGMILVFIAMLLYYRGAGVNAVLALVLNAIILLGAMAWINATLTLPGIAGFILTIGMAVDSNVLIFERIREEMDNGKAPKAAIDLGFKRAFGTIIDTHVTTISAALFLFQFGTGPVKGFAVTLVVGLLASVFTAVFVSHLLFDLHYGSRERLESISI